MANARIAAGVTVALIVAVARISLACPFCDGPTQTLSERFHGAEVIVIARALPEKPDDEETSLFEVLSIERDGHKLIRAEERITLLETARPGTRVLLMGTLSPVADSKQFAWGELVVLSEGVLDYIRGAPDPKREGRLQYFARFLEHSQPTIANDAWGEFANAPYEEIVPIARAFSPRQLRQWLTDPKTPATRFSLYGMMLGLCGGPEDLAELERRALTLEGPDSVSPGIDGITGGYLLLAGEPGLTRLEQVVLHNEDASSGAVFDRVRAVRFMWRYGEGKIPAGRLVESLRPLLNRGELAETIISDLSRWKDWSVMDQVAGMYGKPEFNLISQRRSVVRYLIACSLDAPNGEATPPAHVVAAEKHLEALRLRDPKFVENLLKLYKSGQLPSAGQ